MDKQKPRSKLNLAVLVVVAAILARVYIQRPSLLLVGLVTLDVVEGSKTPSLGGAVSYTAVAFAGIGHYGCVVTAAAPDSVDLSIFKNHDLHVVKTNKTLTFEHSYTFWGNHRKLKVTATPNIKLSYSHVPYRCRGAKTVVLGPLIMDDVEVASFTPQNIPFWWRLVGWYPPQTIGLMAQGLQRDLDADGRVVPISTPSPALEAALAPNVVVFLSDVETEVWKNGTVEALASKSKEFVVTRGAAGADRHDKNGMNHHVAYPIEAVDTNGAGDSFAAAYVAAMNLEHPSPIEVANWAGSQAVSKPQACKPACIGDAIAAAKKDGPLATILNRTIFKRVLAYVLPSTPTES